MTKTAPVRIYIFVGLVFLASCRAPVKVAGPSGPPSTDPSLSPAPTSQSSGDSLSNAPLVSGNSTPICGNGVIDPGEQCDDGNLSPGDSCTPVCTLTPQSVDCSVFEPGTVCIDNAWLMARGSGPYFLDQQDTNYILETDVNTSGSGFAIIASGVTFNLNGHTIKYDNSAPLRIPNGSFEDGQSGFAQGWDFTNAPHTDRFKGAWLQNEMYDGDYSLRFQGPLSNEYVQSTSTLTLSPNTNYSLSAMFQTKNTQGGAYVRIENIQDGSVWEVSYAGANNRGIQFKEILFKTGTLSETYRIFVGARDLVQGAAYVDDVKLQRQKTYGVAVGISGPGGSDYPDITRGGYAPGSSVKNGTVMQGADSATSGHGVVVRQSANVLLDQVTVTVSGANASAVNWFSGDKGRISQSSFISNVRTITSRDDFDGAVIKMFRGAFVNNRILNGPHLGLELAESTNFVSGNTISLKTKYTNAFAVFIRGNTEVSNNTIDCYQGEYACRGIFARGTGNKEIYNNTIRVQALRNNQEYGGGSNAGAMLGGVYGFQTENDTNVFFHNNLVEAYGGEVKAYAIRIINQVNGVIQVNNNILRAIRRVGGDHAAILKLASVEAVNGVNNFTFNNNVLYTNDMWVGETNYVSGLTLTGNTLNGEGDISNAWWFESENNNDATAGVKDLKFVNTVFGDFATRSAFEAAAFLRPHRYTNDRRFADIYSAFMLSWGITFRVRNSAGQALSGATIQIVDKAGAPVATLNTTASGQVTRVLDQFRTTGDSRVDLSIYSVQVTYNGQTAVRAFAADQAQILDFVF